MSSATGKSDRGPATGAAQRAPVCERSGAASVGAGREASLDGHTSKAPGAFQAWKSSWAGYKHHARRPAPL